jgi:DNA-binding MarR family transcriptional regulator
MKSLRDELKQTRPFDLAEEVLLSMLRTADQLAGPVNDVLRQANLSFSQYNVLRILRGAHGDPLACGEIAGRMVRRDPDLTRLLDRLEARGLALRARGTSDRRVVSATITKEGLALLDALDGTVRAAVKASLAHIPRQKLEQLRDLLAECRSGTE